MQRLTLQHACPYAQVFTAHIWQALFAREPLSRAAGEKLRRCMPREVFLGVVCHHCSNPGSKPKGPSLITSKLENSSLWKSHFEGHIKIKSTIGT